LELRALVRLLPQRESYRTLVYWCFVIVCRAVWSLYDYLLASSDLHLPALFPEERARWVSRYLPEIIYFICSFCLFGDFSFIEGNTNSRV